MIEPEWIFKNIDEKAVTAVADEFNLPPTIARIMCQRGIRNRDISRQFFFPSRDQMHDPFLMKDMDKAVQRIQEAISSAGSILVFGDYDVDGTTSAALLTLFFRSINVDVHYYIPNRETEGYGVSKEGVDYAGYIGAKLMITCDCGISDFTELKYAVEKNLDVIVTDHHKPAEQLPPAFAVVNPNRRDCDYPFKGLCGVGVAFKLALALCEKEGLDPDLVWQHADLAALGIAADLVPIKDENRIIAHHGLEQLEKGSNTGLTALQKTGGLWEKEKTIGRLVFWMAPKINAAGRLGDAGRAVKLMTTNNSVYAMEVARELEKENKRRQEITVQITDEALYMAANECDLENDNAIVLAKESWHAGVIGIVASRIKETYSRPAIIISLDGEEGKGSCRSISGFDMVDALRECRERLLGFGGHPMAAGLSLKKSEFPAFREQFLKVAKNEISKDELIPSIYVDSGLELTEINDRFLKFLNAMEPYGPGNMRPVFVSKNIFVEGIPRILGRDQNTLKFSVKKEKSLIETIGFNMAGHYEKLIQNNPIDIAYSVSENDWNGKKIIQLELKDIKMGANHA